MTSCRPPAMVPTFVLDAPACDSAVVGVIDSVSTLHTESEIRGAVLATGWAAEDEPTIVVVDRAPVLQNPETVAEAMLACYPRPLRFHGISGSCRFAVLVDPTGRIVATRLSRAAVLPQFDEAGAVVLGMMRFSPALYRGCRPYYWSELDLTFLAPPR